MSALPQELVLAGASHAAREEGERMEELIFRVASGALAQAGLARERVDSVTLAASDERDGRSISSMLGTAPAGGLLKEVTKVTDGSLHALALAAMKMQAGLSDVHLVVSWEVGSEADLQAVAISALEPFADRPVGLVDPGATATLASAYLARHGLGPEVFDERARRKAAAGGQEPSADWVAHPLRDMHVAPESDGAAAVVLVSDAFAAENGVKPIAHLAGIGWRTDTYSPAERALPPWRPLRDAATDALIRAGLQLEHVDSFELDDSTVFGECLAAERIGLAPEGGGPEFLGGERDPLRRVADDGFVGVPAMCSGLWRIAQVSGAQDGGFSLVHQAGGRAGQIQAVAIVRREGATG